MYQIPHLYGVWAWALLVEMFIAGVELIFVTIIETGGLNQLVNNCADR